MKIFFVGNFLSRLSLYSNGGVATPYINSICSKLKSKLFLRNFICTNKEEEYTDDIIKEKKKKDIVNDIFIQKQKDFSNKFEEYNNETEEYSTVKIFNKDNASNDFLLNNERYKNFIKRYNDQKTKNNSVFEKKKNKFGQKIPLEDNEKSLWEILKEKEDYLRNKKKLKLYQKEIYHKMNRESEKIKKEENFIKLDQDKNKNAESLNSYAKSKYKKKNNIDDIRDDIDIFLKNDDTYTNDIKSYDEIYQDFSKRNNENEKNEKLKEENSPNNKVNCENDEFNINHIIQDNLNYNTIYDEMNKYNNDQKKLTSGILINDLNTPENNNPLSTRSNSLFIEETDPITAKKCIQDLSKENKWKEKDEISKKSEDDDKNVEKKKKDAIKKNNEMKEKNIIEVKPSEIIKRLSGESISTIIDGNIDNLIIQREIKKEKTVSGIITAVYNNLHNCDPINLSSALLKVSKLIDSYQKQSIIKNYMFLCIIKKVEENLSLFEISNLVQIFYAFVKIDYLPFFFNDIINLINNKISDMEAKHICSILYTLSNIILETNESRNLKNKVIDIIKTNISMFVCLNDVICLLTSLSKLKYKDVNTYYQLSKKIEENLDQLSMKNISNILWSFSNVNYTCKLVKKVKKIIEKNIHNSNYLDVINIMYSLTKLNEFDDHLYNDVFYNAINVYIHNMSIKNLCIILWSYTFANVDKPDLYINILTKVNENMKHITSKDVVSILTCLSRIKYNYRYKHLFNHLKNKVIKNLYAFTPLQLTNVIYHSSFLDIYDHKYYYLLVQQIYQIRKLLYLENLTLILYALKNMYYLNVQNLDVFKLISYILEQIKKKYNLLYGEDCINVMLIINDLMKYTNQGYLNFSYISENKNINNAYYIYTSNNENKSLTNNYIDIFNDDVSINQLNIDNEEVYLPYINDLLYEQIKIRLNNFWQLSIKDVNNLLIIMKNGNMYDDVIINMVMRQIVPILLKSSNIEFLIFLSNITSNRNLKFIALTHLSRRPKLISVFKKKINSITQNILNNFEENENDYSIYNYKPINNSSNEEYSISNSEKNKEEQTNLMDNEKLKNNIDVYKKDEDVTENINNCLNIDYGDNGKITNNSTVALKYEFQKKSKIDINSCISLVYACFNIHYEDDNILKLYDIIEHMIIEEKKPINSFMLINFLYILALTNNKIDLARKLSEEYMHHRYSNDIEQNNQNISNEQPYNVEHTENEVRSIKPNLSFNLFYESNDKLSSYIQKGDEDTSLILLKLLYVNILMNKYNYLYHILSEICKYYDGIYPYEFIMLSKQVCYHIYNFSNFFCKNKEVHHIWNKVSENVYINEEHIYLDLNYETTNVNLINEQDNKIINFSLNNKNICKTLDNNMNIAKFFYYILNYNIEDINSRNTNYITSKKEKKKVKMFHFDQIISDILNFLNIQYKGSYIHENIYKICCSFPYERHLIDLITYEDVLFPSNRPLLSSELRQKQLALKGWTVHSINFRDIYNSIKDKNIICYIFNICKKIKKDLNSLPNNNKVMEEMDFWENIKYTNI